MYLDARTPTTATLGLIPSGKAGVVETLKAMSAFAKQGAKDLPVVLKARELIRGCAHKDWSGQVTKLHAFVRDKIQYVMDVNGVETLFTPAKVLEYKQGDCDDKSTLLAAMLESIGHPARFMAVGFEPGIFSHVYVETKIGNKWYPLETTEFVDAGWEPDPRLVVERLPWHL